MRRPCLRVLIMLVVQYALGIFLNLYVNIPASDHDAGLGHEISSAPLSLTLHALLGLALLAAAIVVVVRSVAVGSRELTLLASAGLTAIFGAFAAGELFVRDGSNGASMVMALLAGVAFLCYIGALAVASVPGSARHTPSAAGDEFATYEPGSAVQYGIIEEFDPAAEYEADGYEAYGHQPVSHAEGGYEAYGHQPVSHEARGYDTYGDQPVSNEARGYRSYLQQPVNYEPAAPEPADYEPVDYEPVDYEPSLPMPPRSAERSSQLPRRQPQGQPMPGQPRWSDPPWGPVPGEPARHQPGRHQSHRRPPERHLPEHWEPEPWQPEQERALPETRNAPAPGGWPAPPPRRSSRPYRDE
jgi:hypothetical protein